MWWLTFINRKLPPWKKESLFLFPPKSKDCMTFPPHFLPSLYLLLHFHSYHVALEMFSDGQPWIERRHRPVKGNRLLLSKWALSYCCFFLHTAGKIVRTGKVLLTEIFVTQPMLIWGIAPWPGKPILQQMAFLAHFSPIRTKITLRMPVSKQRFFGSDQRAWLCFSAKL